MNSEVQKYPFIPEPDSLPIFLHGIGKSRYQSAVDRPEGYYWHQILFCAEGCGILEAAGKSYEINSGSYFFLPADFPHAYHPETEIWDVRWVAFDGPACNGILKTFKLELPCVVRAKENTPLNEVFDKMLDSLENDILYCNYVCSGLIYDYIIRFHRLFDTEYGSSKSRRLSLIAPALSYIHAEFAGDISVPELSELAGISQQHFCRIMKELFHCSPMEYINRVRLDAASKLLLEGRTVNETALLTGFKTAGYFSTVFKKKEGCSPLEYVKAHTGN